MIIDRLENQATTKATLLFFIFKQKSDQAEAVPYKSHYSDIELGNMRDGS